MKHRLRLKLHDKYKCFYNYEFELDTVIGAVLCMRERSLDTERSVFQVV